MPHTGTPVTQSERRLASTFAAALTDPDRPKLDVDDDPQMIATDDAYKVGMHLARLATARGWTPPKP